MDLKARRCKPCEGGTKPMSGSKAREYMKFADGWKLSGKRISINRRFKDFSKSIAFINRIAAIAEEEGHHPDISLHDWNQVRLTLTTHAI